MRLTKKALRVVDESYGRNNMNSIGTRLKSIRSSQRLKLKEVSEKSGLAISYISDIENNHKMPSLKSLRKISIAYKIPVNEILKGVQL